MEYEERIKWLETTNTLNNYKKAQEEFILIASHDLQAPLRKLSTFIERLSAKFTGLPEEAKIYTERIQSTAANMRSIINDLASLSYISEGGNDIAKCDLGILVQNVITELQLDKTIFSISMLPVVEGNCIQLKHLFQNLLDNAVKFHKKDSAIHIAVHTAEITEEEKIIFDLAAGKTYCKIEVADNGIGFENEYAEKIFKPFQRLHGKSEYEGNGLGLAICKKIAEKHNGFIYAKGSNDSGASFILILPQTSN
jgi:signal transduction histidine kinase